MARKATPKKELAPEEQLAAERAALLKPAKIQETIAFMNEPSYLFNVGDSVRFGGMKSAVVEEIVEGGKAYLLKCVAVNNNYGKPYEVECYRLAKWVNVRPLKSGDTDFTVEDGLWLRFNNGTVESLLSKCYLFGVDMDPEYQRGYVWDDEDREYLIDSIFQNIDIGKFVFVHLDADEWMKRNVSFEILDGKQRLNTLKMFYENRFPYKGKYFNDLSFADRRTFTEHNISYADVNSPDKNDIYRYFLKLNRSGRKMDKAHLDYVESLCERK